VQHVGRGATDPEILEDDSHGPGDTGG
jgi:hypothetical protein